MFAQRKYALGLFVLLAFIVFASLLSSCGNVAEVEQDRAKSAEIVAKVNVDNEHSSDIEKIVVYNKRQVSVYTVKDRHFEALSEGVSGFLKLEYGGLRSADGGSYDVVSSTQTEQGVLVIFLKPVKPLGKPYNDSFESKRLYIPLSGKLVADNLQVIVLPSPSEYGWDWGGLYASKLDDAVKVRSQLQETVSKLPRKSRNDW